MCCMFPIVTGVIINYFNLQVPRVFIGGKFLGGGSEVRELQSMGKLRLMLQGAGAM